MDLMLDQEIAQVEKVEEQISSSSECSQNSDSSFDLENNGNNKSHLKQLASDQNGDDKKRKGKFGLKYAKISNRQRQALIERVTSTGCIQNVIQSAAKDLSINFSTAKAIMQIFRREGRVTKKIVREIKQKSNKSLGQNNEENIQKKSLFDTQNQKFVKVEAIQDNNETNLFQQAEEANRHQALIIQQLNTQSLKIKTINKLVIRVYEFENRKVGDKNVQLYFIDYIFRTYIYKAELINYNKIKCNQTQSMNQ